MTCEKHPTVTMKMVCGELGCGMCWAEAEAVSYRPTKPMPPVEWVVVHGKVVWKLPGSTVVGDGSAAG